MRWILFYFLFLLICLSEAGRRKRPSRIRQNRPVQRPCKNSNNQCAQRCIFYRRRDRCTCARGFALVRRNGKDCADVNECTNNNGGCEHNCSNIPGSYHCSCRPGYRLDTNQRNCIPEDISTKCPNETNQCQHFCSVTSSGQVCSCRRGYRLHVNGKDCIRLCIYGNGGCYHKCNKDGDRMYCSCHANHVLGSDGKTCTIPPTCAVDNGGCNAECEDTPIGVQCSCKRGYLLQSDRRSCRDIDECAINNGSCQHGCRNSQGSFTCTCPQGFKLASDERTCVDIDECLHNDTCWSGCINSQGSYECTCRKGYQKFAVKRCGDINECIENNGGCAQICMNKHGGFECSCRSGYKLHWNKKDCIRQIKCMTSSRRPPLPPAFVRCHGRNCLLECRADSLFRAYFSPRPSFKYFCGREKLPRLQPSTANRRGKRIPVSSHPLWQVENYEANDTLPECTDPKKIIHETSFRLNTKHCYLVKMTPAAVLSRRVPRVFINYIAISCEAKKRKGKAKISVYVEFILTLPPKSCNAQCKKKLIKRCMKAVKRSLKKQTLRIKTGSSDLQIRRKPTKGIQSGIRTPTGCLFGSTGSMTTKTCSLCAPGTFFDAATSSCRTCPLKTYQNFYGQLSCKPCYRSNIKQGNASLLEITQCPGVCPIGHYSTDGLLPCKPCPRGYYQPETGRIGCFRCGNGLTTRQEGATSFGSCLVRVVCTSGHFYNVGTTSCGRCPKGFYQPSPGKDFCFACPGNTTTDYDASVHIESCKDLHCGGVLGDLHGVVESPNYPGEYPINTRCTWIINPPKKRKILLVIPEIFLPGEDCEDALIMRNKKDSTSKVIYESCQTFENPYAVTARSKKLYIDFRSNDNAGAKGFQIPYVTYDENYDKIIQDIVQDYRLFSADHHQNILKDKRSRQTLFDVLADPEMYFKITPQITKELFPASFVTFLRQKVIKFFARDK